MDNPAQRRRFEALQLHGEEDSREGSLSCSVPIDPSASFRFYNSTDASNTFNGSQRGYCYSRFGNSTVEVFEKRVIALEGWKFAIALSSGAAAVLMTVLALAKAGDNIVSSRSLYCGTFYQFDRLLPSLGVQTRFFEHTKFSSSIQSLIDERTKLIFSESISNPQFSVADYESLVKVAQDAGIPVVIDATFTAAGYFGRLIDYGVDIVIHSATKWIGGHGTALGGIVIDSGNFDWSKHTRRFPQFHSAQNGSGNETDQATIWNRFGPAAFTTYLRFNMLRDFGSTLSPLAAQQLLIGMETLSLRCERQAKNAWAIAEWLRKQVQVAWVSYLGFEQHESHELAKKYLRNGLCTVLIFGLVGGAPAAFKLIDGFKLIINAANVGDSKPIVGHPWSTTHSQLTIDERASGGVTEDLVRISAGTENIEDIIEGFQQAFQRP